MIIKLIYLSLLVSGHLAASVAPETKSAESVASQASVAPSAPVESAVPSAPEVKSPPSYAGEGVARPVAHPMHNPLPLHQPSYNLRTPLPVTSISSLISSLLSTFGNRKEITRRSSKIGSLDGSLYNNIPGSGLEYNLGNLNALNEAINNAMMGLNSGLPALTPSAQSSLASLFASDTMAKGTTKKFLDLPKQWYKMIGEKLSGASEAAVSATVPLKDSLLSTLKSFYSYIKPSRSTQASTYDTFQSGPEVSPGSAGASSLLNFKRRQSSDLYGNQWNGYPSGPSYGQHYPRHVDYSMMTAESQQQYHNKPHQKPKQLVSNELASKHHQANYDQMLTQMIQSQLHTGKPVHQSSALYQKSKEIFAKFARKRVPGQYPKQGSYAIPVKSRIPGQTLAKVHSKLSSLPGVYNQAQPVWSSPGQQASQAKKPPVSYFTSQTNAQQVPSTQQSSTQAPLTSTSISVSVHQSVSGPQVDESSHQDIVVQPDQNQGSSVIYYYDSQPDTANQSGEESQTK